MTHTDERLDAGIDEQQRLVYDALLARARTALRYRHRARGAASADTAAALVRQLAEADAQYRRLVTTIYGAPALASPPLGLARLDEQVTSFAAGVEQVGARLQEATPGQLGEAQADWIYQMCLATHRRGPSECIVHFLLAANGDWCAHRRVLDIACSDVGLSPLSSVDASEVPDTSDASDASQPATGDRAVDARTGFAAATVSPTAAPTARSTAPDQSQRRGGIIVDERLALVEFAELVLRPSPMSVPMGMIGSFEGAHRRGRWRRATGLAGSVDIWVSAATHQALFPCQLTDQPAVRWAAFACELSDQPAGAIPPVHEMADVVRVQAAPGHGGAELLARARSIAAQPQIPVPAQLADRRFHTFCDFSHV